MESRKSRQKGKKKNKKSNAAADRFSSLPDCILHYIFSFLNMEEAVRSSVFSKSWRNLWTSLPTLDFEYKEDEEEDNITDEKMEGIKGFIDKKLLFIDLPDGGGGFDIQRFSFICSKIPQSHVDTWIISALRRNVQELVLGISVSVPTFLFHSKSLTLLKLSCYISGGDLYSESQYLALDGDLSICLPSLKFLFLESFWFYGGVIENFVSSCPVLESLAITNTYFHPTSIQISSLSLKHLVLETDSIFGNDTYVQLKTPNLISFLCKDVMQQNYYLEDVSSLIKAEICMVQGIEEEEILRASEMTLELKKQRCAERMLKLLGALRNVKDLTLSATILEVISHPSFLKSNPTVFGNLRCLKVDASFSGDSIRGLKCLLEISPAIVTLFVNRPQDSEAFSKKKRYSEADVFLDMATYKGGVSLPCSLDKLEHVEIRGTTGCGNVLKLIKFLLKNTKVLKQLVVCPSQKYQGLETH